jgi:hypothetical protein
LIRERRSMGYRVLGYSHPPARQLPSAGIVISTEAKQGGVSEGKGRKHGAEPQGTNSLPLRFPGAAPMGSAESEPDRRAWRLSRLARTLALPTAPYFLARRGFQMSQAPKADDRLATLTAREDARPPEALIADAVEDADASHDFACFVGQRHDPQEHVRELTRQTQSGFLSLKGRPVGGHRRMV